MHALSAPPAFTLSQDQTLLLYEPYLLPSTIQLLKCFRQSGRLCHQREPIANTILPSSTLVNNLLTRNLHSVIQPPAGIRPPVRCRVEPPNASTSGPQSACIYRNVANSVSLRMQNLHWSIAKLVIARPYSMRGLAISSPQPPPLLQRDCHVVRQAHHEWLRSSQQQKAGTGVSQFSHCATGDCAADDCDMISTGCKAINLATG